MKRYLGAFGAAALVFAAVLGSAAALDVDGGAVQSGQDGVRCDTDGVTVQSYVLEVNAPDEPESYGARIGGIADACNGGTLFAKVFKGGKQLGYGQTSINGRQEVVRWEGDPVIAEDITRVQLTIESD